MLLALLASEALAPAATAPASALWWCHVGTTPHIAAASGTSAGLSPATAIVLGLPMWALMSSAMMLPAALPAVRHVAVNSLCWRRGRAIAEFLTVYLAIWLAYGVLVIGFLTLLGGAQREMPFVVLAMAMAWQLSRAKLHALRACHRSSPLPLRGVRATVGVARFGLRNGGACVGSCWAIMLAATMITSARLLWMLAATALVCMEKLAKRPLRATRHAAALLGAAALIAGLFSIT